VKSNKNDFLDAEAIAEAAALGCATSELLQMLTYLGLKALDLPVPMLNNAAVPLSVLAAICASSVTLLVVSAKGDSGRHLKAKSQRGFPICPCSSHKRTRKWILTLRGRR
jgi:hypothetical protein